MKMEKLEGQLKIYYENGKLETIGNYKNREREGNQKWYRENGKLEQIEKFSQ